MDGSTRFVGLDVSKAKVAIAFADAGVDAAQFVGTIANTPEKIRQAVSNLGAPQRLQVCYEAGPTGYGIYRLLGRMGVACTVIAPTLTPHRPGDRVKTDRRDALDLARLHRAGALTAVWVPGEEDETLRDLVRAREDAKVDQLRARHRLSKFLLRHDLHPPTALPAWSKKHRQWLESLKLDGSAGVIFREYLYAIDEIVARVARLEAAIHHAATDSPHAPVIQALQTLRGVAEVTATTIVAEVGCFSRFRSPRQLMAYTGLVPREYSSGAGRWQGGITRTGNAHLRRVVIESSWAYRHRPAVGLQLRRRQEGQSAEVCAISWRAQHRLHEKFMRLTMRGKGGGVASAAVAREFLGFAWAIGRSIEDPRHVPASAA